jgi:predicted acyltransferase
MSSYFSVVRTLAIVDGPKEEIKEKIRYMSIDVFRGLAIVAMIFVNTLSPFENTPPWSKHAFDFGLTYVDLVAPFFIFAIALTFKMSFTSTLKREGRLQAYVKFIRRYAAFLGFGLLGSIFISPTGINFGWGVFQSIGIAGIFTVFFIEIPRFYRFLIGFLLLEIYQFVIGLTVNIDGVFITISDLGWGDDHGGFIGGFGYGALLLLATAIIDDFRETEKLLILIYGLMFTVFGISLHFIWAVYGFPNYGGLSKLRVSHSYVLLTIGMAALSFLLIWLVFDHYKITKNKSYFLQPQGKNAFFLFLLQPIFLALATLILKLDSHVALVFFFGFLNVAIIWLISLLLDKYKVYITI